MALDHQQKQALIDESLVRAGDLLGDITDLVTKRFYDRCPEARPVFHAHQPVDTRHLEGLMVEQSLYRLMRWWESPGEVETVLLSTMPRHIEELGVTEAMVAQFISMVCDVISDTIPNERLDEHDTLAELEGTLIDVVAAGANRV
jgi:hypothetical protein